MTFIKLKECIKRILNKNFNFYYDNKRHDVKYPSTNMVMVHINLFLINFEIAVTHYKCFNKYRYR